MVSITVPNPDEWGALWILALPLGPCWLVYHCLYRQKDLVLRRAYCETGVECLAHVTKQEQTGRTYKVQYCYQPPGEDVMFHMDFIHVSRVQFHQGRFPVLVLPGQPESATPKSNVMKESQRCDKKFIKIMNVLSVFWSCLFLYLFATTTGACSVWPQEICEVDVPHDILVAAVYAVVLGWVGAAIYYYCQKKPLVTPKLLFKTHQDAATTTHLHVTLSVMPNVLGEAETADGALGETSVGLQQPFIRNKVPIAQAVPITDGSLVV